MTGIRKTHDGITPFLNMLIGRAQNTAGAFARVYPVYQRLQTERFKTENASEGSPWPPLERDYAAYKPRRYGGGTRHKWVGGRGDGRPWAEAGAWKSWPGGGRRMLLGTSTLAGAVIGQGPTPLEGTDKHRVMFTDQSMTVLVEDSGENAEGKKFDYPRFVAERRPFFTFSEASIGVMRDEVSKFMLGGPAE